MARSTKSRPSSTKRQPKIAPSRPATVWMSLVAAMTVVGGMLYFVSQRPTVSADGVAILPLMATTGPSSVEVVLNTRKPLLASQWKSIVIHDSGSPVGSQSSLDQQAREAGLRGIGYHFVIGNGNGMGDGELFVTDRWLSQQRGAHVAGSRGNDLNKQSIGICLVGDGDRQKFSKAQIARLVQLLDTLQRELDVNGERVYLHSDVAAVSSPGKLFPAVEVRRMLAANR
jgi:hypothetical protein